MTDRQHEVMSLIHAFCIVEHLDSIQQDKSTMQKLWNETGRYINVIKKECSSGIDSALQSAQEEFTITSSVVELTCKKLCEIPIHHWQAVYSLLETFIEDGYVEVTSSDVEALVNRNEYLEKRVKELENAPV